MGRRVWKSFWLNELRPTQDLCNLPNMKIEPRSLSCEAIASGSQRPISQIFTRCFGKALSWHHLYESRSGFQMRDRCRMTASGHFANWALKVCLRPRSSRASIPAGHYRWAGHESSSRETLVTGMSSKPVWAGIQD